MNKYMELNILGELSVSYASGLKYNIINLQYLITFG
jgi:hypothetical protein